MDDHFVHWLFLQSEEQMRSQQGEGGGNPHQVVETCLKKKKL